MFTLFKILIMATVIVVGSISIVFLAFIPMLYAIVHIGSGVAAAWLISYLLIIFVAVIILLSQENNFSKKVEKFSKAFWNW